MNRAANLHAARAYLAQVPLFRARELRNGSRERFSVKLLEWASNARRSAMTTTSPVQGDLFGAEQ